MTIQTLIPHPSVEALDVAVLNRLAWLDEVDLHAVRCRPLIESFADQFQSVVDRKRGRVRTHRLAPQPLKTAEQWIARQRSMWEKRLDQLDEYLNELKETK